MISFSELKQRLFSSHYVVNFCFCLVFFIIRYTPALSSQLLDTSSEPQELKVYAIVLLLLGLKFRSSSSAEEFCSMVFLYGKLLNVVLFYMYGQRTLAITYAIIWGVLFVILPQPPYQGPTKIIELSSEDFYNIKNNQYEVSKIKELSVEEAKRLDKGKDLETDQCWIVFFYAMWSPACLNFESTVAKTSIKYETDNVHFGKIDLEHFTSLAEENSISLSPTSLDLPTLILFKNGKEIKRLPEKMDDANKSNEELEKIKSKTLRSAKATWDRLGWDRSMESIVTAFKLDSISKTQ